MSIKLINEHERSIRYNRLCPFTQCKVVDSATREKQLGCSPVGCLGSLRTTFKHLATITVSTVDHELLNKQWFISFFLAGNLYRSMRHSVRHRFFYYHVLIHVQVINLMNFLCSSSFFPVSDFFFFLVSRRCYVCEWCLENCMRESNRRSGSPLKFVKLLNYI